MDFVGLDVSLKPTAICIVDRTGKIVREGVVTSDPVTIATFIKSHAPHLARPCRDAGVGEIALGLAMLKTANAIHTLIHQPRSSTVTTAVGRFLRSQE